MFYFLFGTRDHADCTTHDGNEDSSSAEECTEGAGSLTTIVKGHVRSRIVVEPTRENVALRCSRCLYHACVSFLANVSLSLSLSLSFFRFFHPFLLIVYQSMLYSRTFRMELLLRRAEPATRVPRRRRRRNANKEARRLSARRERKTTNSEKSPALNGNERSAIGEADSGGDEITPPEKR